MTERTRDWTEARLVMDDDGAFYYPTGHGDLWSSRGLTFTPAELSATAGPLTPLVFDLDDDEMDEQGLPWRLATADEQSTARDQTKQGGFSSMESI